MNTEFPDGDRAYREAYFRGLRPDPDLWIDEWADEFMRIPRDTGAPEPGQYRTDRTPYAREPMRCLSPAHPCRRVITMVASQLMKTQIALNWMGGLIHMAPSNILALLPSLGLSKRVSGRITDRTTQKAVKTKYQDKKTGELVNLTLDNDDAPAGLPPVHTDRHIHPNKPAAEQAAKARLAAFNRSTAEVRLEMVGRTDLFAERQINAQGFKDGLDGEFLVDSVEQVFTQSGWSTTVECNAGKKGKAKAAGKKKKKSKEVKVLEL